MISDNGSVSNTAAVGVNVKDQALCSSTGLQGVRHVQKSGSLGGASGYPSTEGLRPGYLNHLQTGHATPKVIIKSLYRPHGVPLKTFGSSTAVHMVRPEYDFGANGSTTGAVSQLGPASKNTLFRPVFGIRSPTKVSSRVP